MCTYDRDYSLPFLLKHIFLLLIGCDDSAKTRTVVIAGMFDRMADAYPLESSKHVDRKAE